MLGLSHPNACLSGHHDPHPLDTRYQFSLPSRSQQYSSRHSPASWTQRSSDSHGSTASSASSSPTPASNASSPRKPAAIRRASRRFSPERREDVDQELLVGERVTHLK